MFEDRALDQLREITGQLANRCALRGLVAGPSYQHQVEARRLWQRAHEKLTSQPLELNHRGHFRESHQCAQQQGIGAGVRLGLHGPEDRPRPLVAGDADEVKAVGELLLTVVIERNRFHVARQTSKRTRVTVYAQIAALVEPFGFLGALDVLLAARGQNFRAQHPLLERALDRMKRIQHLRNDDVRVLQDIDAFPQLPGHVDCPSALVVQPQGRRCKALWVFGQHQLSHPGVGPQLAWIFW